MSVASLIYVTCRQPMSTTDDDVRVSAAAAVSASRWSNVSARSAAAAADSTLSDLSASSVCSRPEAPAAVVPVLAATVTPCVSVGRWQCAGGGGAAARR